MACRRQQFERQNYREVLHSAIPPYLGKLEAIRATAILGLLAPGMGRKLLFSAQGIEADITRGNGRLRHY
jgi:hypothetical protein